MSEIAIESVGRHPAKPAGALWSLPMLCFRCSCRRRRGLTKDPLVILSPSPDLLEHAFFLILRTEKRPVARRLFCDHAVLLWSASLHIHGSTRSMSLSEAEMIKAERRSATW